MDRQCTTTNHRQIEIEMNSRIFWSQVHRKRIVSLNVEDPKRLWSECETNVWNFRHSGSRSFLMDYSLHNEQSLRRRDVGTTLRLRMMRLMQVCLDAWDSPKHQLLQRLGDEYGDETGSWNQITDYKTFENCKLLRSNQTKAKTLSHMLDRKFVNKHTGLASQARRRRNCHAYMQIWGKIENDRDQIKHTNNVRVEWNVVCVKDYISMQFVW
jgi:hypothetical protein